jgi:hypothetical protein
LRARTSPFNERVKTLLSLHLVEYTPRPMLNPIASRASLMPWGTLLAAHWRGRG